ncbi:MAG: hypothetical protein ACO1ON_13010 [Nocardioides sp.]
MNTTRAQRIAELISARNRIDERIDAISRANPDMGVHSLSITDLFAVTTAERFRQEAVATWADGPDVIAARRATACAEAYRERVSA